MSTCKSSLIKLFSSQYLIYVSGILLIMTISFWKNRKILITGHSGFKGLWLSMILSNLGADLYGISSPHDQKTNYTFYDIENNDFITSYFCDICDFQALKKILYEVKPEVIFHLAAQPLVIESYNDPLKTYMTNIIGSANLLESVRSINSVSSIIMITSDKCYDNKENKIAFVEDDKLGGDDPYSSSKACCELLINSFRKSFFKEQHSPAIASVRAGNIIGGGDWGEYRLIPDIVRSIIDNQHLNLRNPLATRPWQHVLDPLYGYILLAQKLCNDKQKYQGAWNFSLSSDQACNVEKLTQKVFSLWKGHYTINKSDEILHQESNFLSIDSNKSNNLLNWHPILDLDKAISWAIDWYKEAINNPNNKRKKIELQIEQYLNLLNDSMIT